jgi:hypothetical protein
LEKYERTDVRCYDQSDRFPEDLSLVTGLRDKRYAPAGLGSYTNVKNKKAPSGFAGRGVMIQLKLEPINGL